MEYINCLNKILPVVTLLLLGSCSTEEPQGNGSGMSSETSRGDEPEEEITIGDIDGDIEGESDHLFKYEDPNIEISSEGDKLVLPYEPVSDAQFFYMVCRDVLADGGNDKIVEYMHDFKWYIDENKPKAPLYPSFKYQKDVDFFYPYDVVGLGIFQPQPDFVDHYNQQVKQFADADVRYVDLYMGYDTGESTMEVIAGEDDWAKAFIDKNTHTVTFTIESNNSGEPRCFTFVMGGWFGNPPTEFLDNGVIVHQAAR